MSNRSTLRGFEKEALCNMLTFCSFNTACSFSVGTNSDVRVLAMYFWTCQIVFSSVSSKNSFHLLILACAISCVYLFILLLYEVFSVSSHVRLYLFRNWFTSLYSSVTLFLHYLLLYEHGFLCGVTSSTVFLIAPTM